MIEANFHRPVLQGHQSEAFQRSKAPRHGRPLVLTGKAGQNQPTATARRRDSVGKKVAAQRILSQTSRYRGAGRLKARNERTTGFLGEEDAASATDPYRGALGATSQSTSTNPALPEHLRGRAISPKAPRLRCRTARRSVPTGEAFGRYPRSSHSLSIPRAAPRARIADPELA